MAGEYSGGSTLSEELKAFNGFEKRGSGFVFIFVLLCFVFFVLFVFRDKILILNYQL